MAILVSDIHLKAQLLAEMLELIDSLLDLPGIWSLRDYEIFALELIVSHSLRYRDREVEKGAPSV